MIGPVLCGGCVGHVVVVTFFTHRHFAFRISRRDGSHNIGRGIGRCHGIGPIMIGPYTNAAIPRVRHTVHRAPTHAHQPFPDLHDPMHVVRYVSDRHHHEFAHVNMWHVFRYRIPTPLRQFAHRVRHHHAIRDLAEQMRAVLRAYRQETCLPTGRYAPSLA